MHFDGEIIGGRECQNSERQRSSKVLHAIDTFEGVKDTRLFLGR